MPISAVFTSDFTKWNEGLRNAVASLKPLEVSVRGVQSDLQKMSKSLSGADIIKQANLATAAVKSIGGATALTATEQKKLNATVTEAIAKYKALGQQAPADLQRLSAQLDSLKQKGEGFGDSFASGFTKMAASVATGQAVFELGKRALFGLADAAIEFGKSSIESFSKAEKATARLTQALKNQGDATPATRRAMEDLSLQFQNTTRFSDDLAQEMEALFIQIGNVGPDQIGVALQAAGDLADGLGIDLEQAVTAVSKALAGNATALHKLAPNLDEAAVKGGNLAEIAATIQQHFGGQSAAVLDTYAGRIEQIGNNWDNVKEKIGGAIVTNDLVIAGLRELSQLVDKASNAQTGLTLTTVGSTAASVAFGTGMDTAIVLLEDYAQGLNDADRAMRKFASGAPSLAQMFPNDDLKTFTALLHGAAASGLAEWEKQNDAIDKAARAAEEAAKKFKALKDELLGVNLVAGLRDLQSQWDHMTDAEKAQALSLGVLVEKYQALASKLPVLPPELRAFAIQMNAAAEAAGKMTLQIGELKPLIDALGPSVDRTGKQFKDWGFEVGFEAVIPMINLGKALKETGGFISELPESIDKAKKETKDWKQSIADLSNAFANLAQISGGALGSTLSLIGKLVGATDLAIKAVDGISAGIEAIQKPGAGLKNMIGGFAQLATGILSAAAAAIQFGKALWDALTKSRPEQLQESVLKDFGVSIGEDLGKIIADSAIKEFGGSFQAAQIGNLDKIISAGGGVTVQNLDKLEARLHDVFSLLSTGELSASQAQDVLNKNFQTFVDFLGGDVNPALKEIIRLNKEFGTQSKVILDFVAKNASLAAGGFTKIVQNINAIPGTLGRIGPIAQATFGALLDGGKSVIDALAEMGSGLDVVRKALKDSGQEASGFLGEILGWQSIVENNKGVFDALSGTLDVLKGLNNAGALTQDAFASLTGTIDDAFSTLIGKGVSATDALKLMQPELQEIWELQKDFGFAVDDATQALLDQAVAEGQVGEKHRSVQEQMLDLQKQELEVLKAIGTAFGVTIPNDISKTGNAFDNLGNKIDDAIAKIPGNVHIPVRFDLPELPDNYPIPFAHGGLVPYLPKAFANGGMVPSEAMLKRMQPVYAAGGFFTPRGTDTVPAMLSPGEFVVSRKGVQSAGLPALRSINHGVAPPGGGNVTTVNVYVTVQALEPQHAQSALMHPEVQRTVAKAYHTAIANGGATAADAKRVVVHLAGTQSRPGARL